MHPMILQLKTLKAKLKKEYDELKIKALRCIYELQNANAYFGDEPELIEAEKLEQAGDELLIVQDKMIKLQHEIKKIDAQLGDL